MVVRLAALTDWAYNAQGPDLIHVSTVIVPDGRKDNEIEWLACEHLP